ncbi:MAG: DNA polymerase IV [Bacteroidota bacterium]
MKSDARKIIHIDMDAFYASVEQRDRPELRGKPLAVGGSGGRGVIAAASYEARKYGVRSAMPAKTALRKCPMLLFVRPQFDKYKNVSRAIHGIFKRYTNMIEPLSLDEAFLDVTRTKGEERSATLIAQQIKNDIYNELRLVASAGVSYNKFLAKIASDQDKPDGLFVIPPEEGAAFVAQLPIDDFFGVGKVTAEKMKKMGIFKGSDLLRYNRTELQQLIGKSGSFLYEIARGIDERPVKTERVRKSIGAESTYKENIQSSSALREAFHSLFEDWWKRYIRHDKKGRTLTVKLRNAEFETFTRSFTNESVLESKAEIRDRLEALLMDIWNDQSVRLLGVSISGFNSEKAEKKDTQLTFW